MSEKKYPFQCKEPGCLGDAIYKGKCRAHAGPIPCIHCGRDASEHHLANYADGPQIGLGILICPNSVLEEDRG